MSASESGKSADPKVASRMDKSEVGTNDPPTRDTIVPNSTTTRDGDTVGDQKRSSKPKSGSSSAAGSKTSDSPPKKTLSQLGDFKLVKKLGQGGMGTVYLAKQVSLDRNVALKTLSKEFAKKDDFVKRFLREARSMAKLQHPNIVQVYAADSKAGFHFAAIEFIDGQSMRDWMDEKKQLSVGDALHVALICADALQHVRRILAIG